MKVIIRRSKLVRPAEETPKSVLWNSNVDLVIPRIHTPSVYIYRRSHNKAQDFFSWDVMEKALAKVLVPFYPLAGRLLRGANDGRIYLNCTSEGALLLEAEVDRKIDDFGDFAPTLAFKQLVPQVTNMDDISSYPLLLLQVTFFQCGGVALGVAMEHHVTDGMSGVHFMNTWADIANGKGITQQPFIDRTLLRAHDPPTPKFMHLEYQPPPALLPSIGSESHFKEKTKAIAPNEGSLVAHGQKYGSTDQHENATTPAILHLTREQVKKLRANATDAASKTTYSTYEAVSAHIWRCVSKARELSGQQETKLYIATDGRKRIQPPLPPGYFGNAIFNATPLAKAGELERNPLSFAAQRIRDALVQMNDEYLRSALAYLEVQPNLEALVRGAHTFRSPNLGITSWTRMPTHDCDFGWGRPIFMGPAGIPFEGLAYLLPSPRDDGRISVSLALQSQYMSTFQKLFFNF